jgi:isopentenyl diphosphate isomerase/L-lactate dehydrogenase-like FMN-dependent dehydrogenase/biotin carboxylase
MENIKGKSVLIIGGGVLQEPVISRAREMGITTVVVDGNPEAPGVKIADHFINSSTLDAEATLREVVRFNSSTAKIDGVLTVGTDATYTVAVCAKELGLPGIDPDTALRATDKYLMRKALRTANVPVPDFEVVDSIHKAMEIFEKLENDCVIKPLRNMGARGVRRVSNIDELKEAFELAKSFSIDGRVIIEQYIEAPELSIDALVYNGDITITGVADRIIEYSPYFVETGHIMPSNLPENQVKYAVDTFKAGIKAIGIDNGAAKGDIKISGSSCFVGEIAGRLSGGFMSAYTYPYSSGVDLMENALRIALGFPPHNLTHSRNYVSIERAIIAPPGVVQDIVGLDEARNIEFVKDIFFHCKVGDTARFPKNNLDKFGHIIVAAPDRFSAIRASHNAIRTIKISTVAGDEHTIPEAVINDTARERFNGRCFVCNDCTGERCRGMMPGVGGIATGEGFVRSVKRIRRIDIIPRYINDAKVVDTSADFFGAKCGFPVLPGPITGAITNLGGAISELNLAQSIVKGANQAGTVGFVGDGATPTKFKIGIRVIMENFGLAVPIFKPRYDQKMIFERIEAAKSVGALAVGMDIDAASFMTMDMKGQSTSTKTFEELRELVRFAEIPFILKGILSPFDAELALKAGVKGIIVSNHGGRVSDSLVAPIDMIADIKRAVGSDAVVILDGGVRSGADVLKALALGADFAMIGRPVMIYAVGGGVQAVRQYFERIAVELKKAMTFVGVNSIGCLKGKKDALYFRD